MGRDNQERVGLINAALKREGITTWSCITNLKEDIHRIINEEDIDVDQAC